MFKVFSIFLYLHIVRNIKSDASKYEGRSRVITWAQRGAWRVFKVFTKSHQTESPRLIQIGLGFCGFSKIPTYFLRFSQNLTKSHRIPQNPAKSHRILKNPTDSCWIPQIPADSLPADFCRFLWPCTKRGRLPEFRATTGTSSSSNCSSFILCMQLRPSRICG